MEAVRTVLYWAHISAAVLWIGGISYSLFAIMPNMPMIALRDRANFVPAVLRRFLRIVWTAIGILVITGLFRIFYVWNVSSLDFFSTGTGHMLAAKLVIVTLFIGLAIDVTFNAVPKAITHVATHADNPPDAYKCVQCAPIMGGLRRRMQVGLGLGLTVLLLAVMLRGA